MSRVDGVQSIGQLAAPAPSPVPDDKLPERRELVRAVKALNAVEYLGNDSELTFALDRESKRPVMKIVDRKTNEVIRQIPPEYVLRIAEELRAKEHSDG